MNKPIIDLQKVSYITSTSEKFGGVAGIDGATQKDLITARFKIAFSSLPDAGKALVEVYNFFDTDEVNLVVQDIIDGRLIVSSFLQKIIGSTTVVPLNIKP